jgi:hypothetical protein
VQRRLTPDVEVYGLSRRSAPLPPGVIPVSSDLFNAADVRQKLKAIKNVTHIVFCACVEKPTAAENSEVNVAMLRSLPDVVEETSPSLKHVCFYQDGNAERSWALSKRLRAKTIPG